jgi:hypothetical protein
MIPAIIPAVSGLLSKVVDRVIPDPVQADKIKAEMASELLRMERAELEAAASIITAEAQGESWLQRNWRPMLMLWFAGLVGAHWLGFTPPNLPESVVNSLLDIVQVGVGGYVVGRSGEKMLRIYKSKD